MSFIGRLFSRAPERTKASGLPAGGFLPLLGSVASASGQSVNQATAISVSTVYASVTQRAKDVTRCTPRLVMTDLEGGPRKVITDHPVARLFRRPNWIQTWFEFCVQMHVAFLLRGNAYAVIIRNANAVPVALIPVNPDAVTILEASDGSLFYQVNRVGLFQMAALSDFGVAIPAEDVIHLRALTFNMLIGPSTLSVARESVGVAMGLQQQQSRFMGQGARPSGVLQTAKKLTEDAAKRLRQQWEDLRSGIQNAGRTAILEEGLEWKPMQLTSVDLQFVEQMKLSVEDVARYFGMPLYKLGGEIPRGLRIDELDQSYVNSTIMPDLEMWEQKIEQAFDLDKEGISADFNERNLLRAEEATRVNNGRLAVMSGLITINEWRAEEGLAPHEGADELLRPVNLAAIGSDLSGTAPDGAGRPAEGTPPDPGAPNAKPQGGNE